MAKMNGGVKRLSAWLMLDFWITGLFPRDEVLRISPSYKWNRSKAHLFSLFGEVFSGASSFRCMRFGNLFHQVVVPFTAHLYLANRIENERFDQLVVHESIGAGLAELIQGRNR